ncbi:MAG: twin-arginine translocase TatA/TatE family subunit [Thermoleophilia bacterium]
MPSIGWQELVVVGVVVLLIFGPRRLPEVGRSMGSALKEFKSGTREIKEQTTMAAEAVAVEPKGDAVKVSDAVETV